MNQLSKTSTIAMSDWHALIAKMESSINSTILGQEHIVRLMTIATLSRGHILLEGDVGVGKTTLLKTVAECLGGNFERIEGTIDLMPHDLVYYTYIAENGKPGVSSGPVLKHGDELSIFFFNEINRARPQVHSLLLRIMAERSVHAFNQTHFFPHLQVFADRNRIEKDETFELPAAARDRFMMELHVEQPKSEVQLKDLMFNPRYHDADKLVDSADKAIVPFQQLNDVAAAIQEHVHTSEKVQDYGYHLCRALREPAEYGIQITDVDTSNMLRGGMGPRGISYLARGARVNAWLNGRDALVPEDFHMIIRQIAKHRLFLNPVYDYNRDEIVESLITAALNTIQSP
ncbi:MAG: MoxR family ATPase [Pseudomonadota bacterium]|jgi:MoxR-like ATPase|uniref:MoxR-like ATPase n=1 Tax=Methylophaga aminisulfidivorans MP TaxID=1026882 RepID=F5SWR6_9GAMM|nr:MULTISPECIES: MoxR family ATPase [Methylophaga]EGL54513.1 moxR-like ATPase [Methylophaga aminisulfidivorans MP]MEC9412408.1 MoxR family ATPase [Pseudomonadota bacterium]